MTRRNRRPRFNGSDDDHAATEQWFSELHTSPEDGTTYELGGEAAIDRIRAAGYAAWEHRPDFTGGSDLGVMVIEVSGAAPLAAYRPEPASFPALQAAPQPEPERPVLADVDPLTETAVIGNALRLPIIWCEMPRCINWHHDPDSLGEHDSRERAIARGWREDALGRFACPPCQQGRSDYRTPQPLTWQHPGIPRRWHERGTLPGEDTQDRLTGAAEYARYVTRTHPDLAAAMAGATPQDGSIMTAREMIVALLAYDLDAPLWVGKGVGPADGIEPVTGPTGEITLIIKPVTP